MRPDWWSDQKEEQMTFGMGLDDMVLNTHPSIAQDNDVVIYDTLASPMMSSYHCYYMYHYNCTMRALGITTMQHANKKQYSRGTNRHTATREKIPPT